MKKYIFIIIGAIVLSIIGYGVYTYYQINNPKGLFDEAVKPPQKEIIADKNEDKTETPVVAEVDPLLEDPFEFTDRVNFLFLGLDASVERYGIMDTFRTDTIMLISADFENNKVDIISIPRDSYVEIPGREKREKINAAFTRGGGLKGKGFEKSIETVSHFLGGIPVHHYIGVDMNVVKDVVNIMGGIDYDVDIRVQIGERVVEKGFQHLDGQQVLDYSRTRRTGRGDIDRIDRQQRIVMAIFKELKSTKQLLKLPRYYRMVMERVHTDLDIKQIAGLALFAVRMEQDNIDRHMVPGGFLNMDKISYWGIDERGKKNLIREVFGVDIEIDPKNDIKFIKNELKEKEKVFRGLAAESRQLAEGGNRLISGYDKVIKEDEIERIKYHISKADHAVEGGDLDSVKKENAEFRTYISDLKTVLSQRSDAINKAETLLSDIAGKMKKYQDYMKAEERDTLDIKIGAANKAIAKRDTKSIEKITNDLEEYSIKVFKDCQKRKEAKEKEDKEKEDRAAAELKVAKEKANKIIKSVESNIEAYKNFIQLKEKDNLKKGIASLKTTIDSKDIKRINKEADELEKAGKDIFKKCEERKKDEEKEPPEENDPESNEG